MTEQPIFLTPEQLVARWNGRISVGTLANWRSMGRGPAHVKIGSRVLYRLATIETWEQQNIEGNKGV